jgi:hypothetical protein
VRSAARQLGKPVAGTAFLEGCGELQVLEFQEHLCAGTISDSVRDSTNGVSRTWPPKPLAQQR